MIFCKTFYVYNLKEYSPLYIVLPNHKFSNEYHYIASCKNGDLINNKLNFNQITKIISVTISKGT